MNRRKFLMVSTVAASLASIPGMASAQAANGVFDLTIEPVDSEMIDGQFVFSLMFFNKSAEGRPVLEVTEGNVVTINISNLDTRPHGFGIPGIPTASIASIPAGGQATVRFTAPVGGSYMYIDPTLAPLNRIMGLYGAFIVSVNPAPVRPKFLGVFCRSIVTSVLHAFSLLRRRGAR